jgi:hypothetical protein
MIYIQLMVVFFVHYISLRYFHINICLSDQMSVYYTRLLGMYLLSYVVVINNAIYIYINQYVIELI